MTVSMTLNMGSIDRTAAQTDTLLASASVIKIGRLHRAPYFHARHARTEFVRYNHSRHHPQSGRGVAMPGMSPIQALTDAEQFESVELYRAHFENDAYVCIRRLISADTAAALWRHATRRAESGSMRMDDPRATGTPSSYADPTMEWLLERLRPTIEQLAGCRLFPSYSYFRVYKHGDTLARHVDRPACELSVSLNLGQEPDEPWPLGILGRRGENYALLSTGDGLLYRGTECPHWRDAYQGQRLAQVFLHYVEQGGPNESWKFDRRGGLRLGSSSSSSITGDRS